MSSSKAVSEAQAGKRIPTYCYPCINGPDLLTVKVVDGVATEIEPNFAVRGMHPADGRICVKPYGLLQKLYNPHRVLKPMRRTNPRKGRNEDPGWVEIGWSEALDIVAEKLRPRRGKPPRRPDESLREHQELLAAIQARGSVRVEQIMRQHIVRARTALRQFAD